MNYEQKYKEALEKARKELQSCGTLNCDAARQIFRFFPELRENEDERILREIISIVKYYRESCITEGTHRFDDCISWLEKQRKQKSNNNTKPKFNVDDWITNGDYTWKIVEVKPLDYILQSQDGNIVDDTISHVDTNFNLWTIQDAKDGNVLNCDNGNYKTIYLFKKQMGSSNIANAYFQILNTNNKLRLLFDKAADFNLNTKPATKEQCDILFQKMYDAGYTWDAEKKELIKMN